MKKPFRIKDAMEELGKWLCYQYDLPIEIALGPITTHRQVFAGTVCPGTNMAVWVEDELAQIIQDWRS